MSITRLRVFPYEPDPEPIPDPVRVALRPDPGVPVRLGELFPLLAQAHRLEHLWLSDFADDALVVSSDLMEVVRAFARHSPAVAAPAT